ncbi:Hypothetical_protein [Hexamita inflata]|uniref:Hypothetical_protein n=1 Tax=Hexamita inflata TaxID=28002 RepID=A0AA86Q1D4_9EUKA|nr:Hypothetical protein HINF_LOCUS31239 [Hexamita inflata]
MKQLYKEINRMLEESEESSASYHIPISFNQVTKVNNKSKQYNKTQTEQVIEINKDILNKNKKKLLDDYVDIQISRSLFDISRSRSNTQCSVTNALPNLEIRNSQIHRVSQVQQAKRSPRKSFATPQQSKGNLIPHITTTIYE